MIATWRTRLLAVLKLPPEPVPPAGAPGSIRVFRAGIRYYALCVVRWVLGQLAALVGIVVSIGFLMYLDADVRTVLAERRAAHAAETSPVASGAPGAEAAPAAAEPGVSGAEPARGGGGARGWRFHLAERVAAMWFWMWPLIKIGETFGIVSYLAQLVVTLLTVRLDYELRWYMVTDRSLRIRAGVWKLQEITMSFANLQQVEVAQGPLQRLLGIADVRVQSAGGGGGGEHDDEDDSLHAGVFHGVTNASEIRDLIQARLREFREAGLGDPDDHGAAPVPVDVDPAIPPSGLAELQDAARELLVEARALRASGGGETSVPAAVPPA